jgi:GTP-binding protein
MTKPIVAIVGRANVGKSTLFNRLSGKSLAIVVDLPGTTRDRIYADVPWEGGEFTLVDTGGLETRPTSDLSQKVKQQVEMAIAEADAILFLVDGKEGLMPLDHGIADLLRRTQKPILLVVNKMDNLPREPNLAEFYRLGLGEPLPISAYHGKGVEELLDELIPLLPPYPPPAEEELLKVAIVGRTNVGKSQLLNAILGQERSIVYEMPGTTRDSLDTLFERDSQRILLIDTAGIRKRGKIGEGAEKYSVLRAIRAIHRCDIALLVMDATEMVTTQDLHIAGYIHQAHKGLIVVVNKWDLIKEKDTQLYISEIRTRLRFIPYVPIIFISAKLGWGIPGVLTEAQKVYQERKRVIPSAQLNQLLKEAIAAHPPPRKGKRILKLYSLSQTQINPPTFLCRVNEPELVHFSYERFLENRLRQAFGFKGTPLRLLFRKEGR